MLRRPTSITRERQRNIKQKKKNNIKKLYCVNRMACTLISRFQSTVLYVRCFSNY